MQIQLNFEFKEFLKCLQIIKSLNKEKLTSIKKKQLMDFDLIFLQLIMISVLQFQEEKIKK